MRRPGKVKRKMALINSFLAQSTAILGGLAGYFAAASITIASAFLIPFAAGGFIYIAASDLVPEMHKMYKGNIRRSISVLSFFIIGIAFMLMIKIIAH